MMPPPFGSSRPTGVTAGEIDPDAPEKGEWRERPDGHAPHPGHHEIASARDPRGGLAKRIGDAAVGAVDRRDRRNADRDAHDRQDDAKRMAPCRAGHESAQDEAPAAHVRRGILPSAISRVRSARRAAASECVARRSVTPRSRRTLRAARAPCFAVAAVEVAGRLVGEQQPRARDERPRDRDPLHLAAGELVGVRRGAVGEADAGEEIPGARRRRPPGRRAGGAARRSRRRRGGAGD